MSTVKIQFANRYFIIENRFAECTIVLPELFIKSIVLISLNCQRLLYIDNTQETYFIIYTNYNIVKYARK